MTPAEIKKTRLYRALAPCVIRKDREELARRLVDASNSCNSMFCANRTLQGRVSLSNAFFFDATNEGHAYWWELRDRLQRAGHECW